MDSEKVIKRDNEYVLHTYGRNPVVLEKGHGLYAEGPEGQKYLDFTSGIGVNSLGYCDLTWGRGCVGAGPQAAAHLQPVLHCPLRQAGQKALQAHRHEQSLLWQLGCRGQRGCHQGGPQIQL